jgi:hypothetical protein
LFESIGGHLSSIDFNFEILELSPEEFNQNPEDCKLTTNMTGDKRKSSSKATKAATLLDASIDSVAEIIKAGEGILHIANEISLNILLLTCLCSE